MSKNIKDIYGNDVNIGCSVEIIYMLGEIDYCGRVGQVRCIDDAGQIHGTWGGCAIIPGCDEFCVVQP